MEFENYSHRITLLLNSDTFKKPSPEYKQVSRFTAFRGEMVKKTVVKAKFSQLNDKRLYFPDGLVSFPFGHPYLKEIDDFKKEKDQKIEKYFWEEKEQLLKMEKKALKNTSRLLFYHSILMIRPKTFDTNQRSDFTCKNKTFLKRNTKDIILSGQWMK